MWDSPSSRPAVTMLDASTMLDIVDQIKLFLFYSRRHRHTTVDATKIMIDTIPVSARLIQTLSALKKLSFFVSFSSLKRTVNHLFVILSLKTETFYPGGAWVTPISCHKSRWLARTCVYIWSQTWLEVWDSERSHLARDQDCHGNIREKNRNYSEKSEILEHDRSEESCNYYLNWDVMKHGSNPMYDFHP